MPISCIAVIERRIRRGFLAGKGCLDNSRAVNGFFMPLGLTVTLCHYRADGNVRFSGRFSHCLVRLSQRFCSAAEINLLHH
jgi:hypothetical protein